MDKLILTLVMLKSLALGLHAGLTSPRECGCMVQDRIQQIQHGLREVGYIGEVAGTRGYTDYGSTFKGFVERYENLLTHKTSVLIFGDARNNWLNDQAWALQEIKASAKKVYWFNPEPQTRWSHGDSRMHI